MTYNNIKQGRFISRPNRFIANIEIDGRVEVCHVKNTGRCRELLIENATVYVEESQGTTRKTKYDLIAVQKGSRLVNMDSQAPNKAAAEFIPRLFDDVVLLRREYTYGNSRFDFYVEAGKDKAFIEVKGVTLEEDGVALFPDAPTERGVKHLHELCRCVENGYRAYVLFVIQMQGVKYFTPNIKMHKAFGEALREAAEKGVEILAVDCIVTPESMTANEFVKVCI